VNLRLAGRAIPFLAVAYCGLYASLLQPHTFVPCSLNSHFQLHLSVPHYRVGGAAAEIAFGPLAWLDRKLRPNFWASSQPLPGMTVEEANAATARDQRGGFSGFVPSSGL
jgi:hypothetical protein